MLTLATPDVKTPLNYWGGKVKIARWVASHLPTGHGYAEPFCGMASVLLARPPIRVEILNDVNGAVANWWRMCRDRKDELIDMLDWTEHSKAALVEAIEAWDDPDPLKRAWAFAVQAGSAVAFGGTNVTPGHFNSAFTSRTSSCKHALTVNKLRGLHDRLRSVNIQNMDGVALLDRLADDPEMVIYCDPPYADTTTHHYHSGTDISDLDNVIAGRSAFIAISGPEPSVGTWHRYALEHRHQVLETKDTKPVVETLWTNRPAIPRLFD